MPCPVQRFLLTITTAMLIAPATALAQTGQANDPDLYRPAPHRADTTGQKVLSQITGAAAVPAGQIDAGYVVPQVVPTPAGGATSATGSTTSGAPSATAPQDATTGSGTGAPAPAEQRVSAGSPSGRVDAKEGGALVALLLTLGLPLGGLLAGRAIRGRARGT